MIRTLLVDDEAPARERLRRMLAAFDDVEIVGEAENGEQALERIDGLTPDLVFLDIQMPACTGLDVAASLKSPRPHIVFCTAYDAHAVDAFDLHAVDYVLKPVSRMRLEQALARVRTRPAADSDEALGRLGAAGASYPSRFLGKHGTTYRVIASRDVLYFAADEGQTRLQTRERHYWVRPTIAELEARLDPRGFFRVSRAAIVNFDAIDEVVPLEGGGGEVRLGGGVSVSVSRRRLAGLIQVLGEL
jgi:two-component system LytT family response regulator